MPEGHTLHRLALDINEAFQGRVLSVSSPQGRFTESAAQLDGSVLVESTAHGKHLFCEFESDVYLHIHLGLIGKFRITRPTPPRGAVRVRFATSEAVGDLRGPILCVLKTPDEIGAQIAELGPDPLRPDADPELAWRRITRSRRSIAALLMDQKVLSGVGNVYRAEVLYRNRINPHRPGNLLFRRSWLAVWADLLELMACWIGGSTPCAPSTCLSWSPSRGVGAAATTSIGGPACRAGSAARPCRPRCSRGATSSGARDASAGAELRLRARPDHL